MAAAPMETSQPYATDYPKINAFMHDMLDFMSKMHHVMVGLDEQLTKIPDEETADSILLRTVEDTKWHMQASLTVISSHSGDNDDWSVVEEWDGDTLTVTSPIQPVSRSTSEHADSVIIACKRLCINKRYVDMAASYGPRDYYESLTSVLLSFQTECWSPFINLIKGRRQNPPHFIKSLYYIMRPHAFYISPFGVSQPPEFHTKRQLNDYISACRPHIDDFYDFIRTARLPKQKSKSTLSAYDDASLLYSLKEPRFGNFTKRRSLVERWANFIDFEYGRTPPPPLSG